MRAAALVLMMAGVAAPASAGELRDFCGERPGIGSSACTLDPGHVQVELGLADWTLDRRPDARTDEIDLGDMLVRIGIADHAEVQLEWTSWGHVRTRDRTTGAIDRTSGSGDLTLAVRRNLLHPDGSGTTIALQPYVTLPVGSAAIGDGTWSAGLVVPFAFPLSDMLSIEMTPTLAAAPDEDRHGRHLAYGNVFGLGIDLSDKLDADLELSLTRDEDPAGHSTEALAGLSVGWVIGENVQLDAGANLGLNGASPDLEIYAGVSRRF
jgi:Putative MetA-pathway of phenol degradation